MMRHQAKFELSTRTGESGANEQATARLKAINVQKRFSNSAA